MYHCTWHMLIWFLQLRSLELNPTIKKSDLIVVKVQWNGYSCGRRQNFCIKTPAVTLTVVFIGAASKVLSATLLT